MQIIIIIHSSGRSFSGTATGNRGEMNWIGIEKIRPAFLDLSSIDSYRLESSSVTANCTFSNGTHFYYYYCCEPLIFLGCLKYLMSLLWRASQKFMPLVNICWACRCPNDSRRALNRSLSFNVPFETVPTVLIISYSLAFISSPLITFKSSTQLYRVIHRLVKKKTINGYKYQLHASFCFRSLHRATFSRAISSFSALDFKPANIRIWIHNKDIGKLQQVLWEGHGQKLRCETSNHPRIRKFLEAVPCIMVRH